MKGEPTVPISSREKTVVYLLNCDREKERCKNIVHVYSNIKMSKLFFQVDHDQPKKSFPKLDRHRFPLLANIQIKPLFVILSQYLTLAKLIFFLFTFYLNFSLFPLLFLQIITFIPFPELHLIHTLIFRLSHFNVYMIEYLNTLHRTRKLISNLSLNFPFFEISIPMPLILTNSHYLSKLTRSYYCSTLMSVCHYPFS